MEKYIPKSALVAEIERKKIPFKKDIDDGVYPTYLCALMDFEDFINTLEVKEVQEEPVSVDLEEAAYTYAANNGGRWVTDDGIKCFVFSPQEVKEAFHAGAQWQRERLISKACEWLKENATYVHPRKGVETCMVNLTVFKEAMEE